MQPNDQGMALAKRALAHLRNRTTDQAEGTMELPITAYTDPERYRREVDRVFRHLPLALALSIELPAPRSWRAMTVLDVPVLLVRADDGVVRAFINVCRHRGAKLVATGSGTAQRFVCPYHAWQYDLKGELKGVYGAATFGEVGPQTHSLTELFCAERHGLVWVGLTPGETFDIDQWLGEFGTQLDTLKLGEWHLYDQRELPGPGWKVTWDGYLEGYHHNLVHPNTVGKYTIGNLTLHDTWGPHQRIVFGRRTLEELAKTPEAEWQPDAHIRRIHLGFPNLAISGVTGDHCLVSQVFPGPTPETTITRQTVLAARKPETDEQKQVTATFSDLVLRAVRDEDYVINFGVQEGFRSGGNKTVVFGRNEPALQHFHKVLAEFTKPGA
ncbi:MAG TPA: aromatic ring-hydroxylating dioxygenase subunit alpha [Variovorax sp.]|nr:aromatic ring-hydroxylating dioxygenase subunit alpha [Variovorax sp.]